MQGDDQRSEPEPAAGARSAPRPIPLLEWLIAGLGALLVAGTIGYLALHAVWRDDTPPDIRIVALRVVERGGGYLVEFRAINEGRQAAAQLLIEGQLAGDGAPLETSEATLDYLPPRSHRDGGLFFTRDPRQPELALRAKGYARP